MKSSTLFSFIMTKKVQVKLTVNLQLLKLIVTVWAENYC